MGLVPSDSFEASQPSLEMQVDPAPEAMTGMACLPLSVRAGRLQAGSTLIKVRQGACVRVRVGAAVCVCDTEACTRAHVCARACACLRVRVSRYGAGVEQHGVSL
eukprot:6178721-Pleurochrysis_carterae.AAC.1